MFFARHEWPSDTPPIRYKSFFHRRPRRAESIIASMNGRSFRVNSSGNISRGESSAGGRCAGATHPIARPAAADGPPLRSRTLNVRTIDGHGALPSTNCTSSSPAQYLRTLCHASFCDAAFCRSGPSVSTMNRIAFCQSMRAS